MASTTSFYSLVKAVKSNDARVYVHGLIELNEPAYREGEGALYTTPAEGEGTPTIRVIIGDINDKSKVLPAGTVVNVTGYLVFNKANRKVAIYTTAGLVGEAVGPKSSEERDPKLGKLFTSFTGLIVRRLSSAKTEVKKTGVARWDIEVPRARKPFTVW